MKRGNVFLNFPFKHFIFQNIFIKLFLIEVNKMLADSALI